MEPLLWSDRFSVGIAELDAQHRALFTLINDLQTAVVFSMERHAVEETLNRMTDYLNDHFTLEEQYMSRVGFPGLEAHHAEHAEFVLDTLRFMKRFVNEGDQGLANEILHFLKDWLVNHILKIDGQYAEFFRKHPESPAIREP